MVMNLTQLATAITAIGALGTAAFGVVDATKLIYGGVSSSGFIYITRLVKLFAPDEKGVPHQSAITRLAILGTLKANWLNGALEADLKSTAKALIKLRLNPETAGHMAAVTGVPADGPAGLVAVAISLTTGLLATPAAPGVPVTTVPPLTAAQMNTYGRFDLLLSTMIDRAYQKADQRYRNTAKMAAGCVAVLLAEIAAVSIYGYHGTPHRVWLQALVVGLLATPLAPVAKDLATSLSAAANAVQSVKG
jgi:hypothetical protein